MQTVLTVPAKGRHPLFEVGVDGKQLPLHLLIIEARVLEKMKRVQRAIQFFVSLCMKVRTNAVHGNEPSAEPVPR